MSMLSGVLAIEKEEILEWVEDMEDKGHLSLTQFNWKGYIVNCENEMTYTVIAEGSHQSIPFESWEECLDYIVEKVKSIYNAS